MAMADLFREAVGEGCRRRASDLYLTAGQRIWLRCDGMMQPLDLPRWSRRRWQPGCANILAPRYGSGCRHGKKWTSRLLMAPGVCGAMLSGSGAAWRPSCVSCRLGFPAWRSCSSCREGTGAYLVADERTGACLRSYGIRQDHDAGSLSRCLEPEGSLPYPDAGRSH